MSSKILRGVSDPETQRHAWSTWSTEKIDSGALRIEETPQAPRVSLQETQSRLEEQLAAARQAGYHEGEAAGRAACRKEVEEAARQMAQAVRNALGEKARLRSEAEREVVQISLAIAAKILRREVRIDPGVALGLVKAAMETVSAREIQSVRTTPAMAQHLSAALSKLGIPEGVRVVPDASLELGGLVVETVRGEVDASLETQFEEISRGLLEAVGDGGGR